MAPPPEAASPLIAILRRMAVAAMFLAALLATSVRAAEAPQARRGVIDLTVVPAQGVRLEGEWALVRNTFLDPAAMAMPDGFFRVPSPWNDSGGAHGFGTYALQVNCPAGQKLALAVPAERSAMRLYVNGTLVAQQGEPGESAAASRPAVGPRSVVTGEFACPLAITAHVSNYSHRHGGMVRAPLAGERAWLLQDARGQLVFNTMMLGGYAVLALLSLIFFAARRKDRTPLYFGLFCVAQGVFADMMSERTVLLAFSQQVSWETYLHVEYVSWYANMATFLMLAWRLFTAQMRWPVVRAFLVVICAAMLAVAVLPARITSHMVPYGQALCVSMGIYITASVAVSVRRLGSDAVVMLAGLAFLLTVVVIDAVLYNAGYWVGSLTSLGLLGFALAPGIVMARRLARALNAEELHALEQQVRGDLLVRSTQAGIFDWDTTRDHKGYSQRLQHMLGEPEQLRAGNGPMTPIFHAFVHADDRERVVRQFDQAMASRATVSGEVRHPPSEYRLVRADGGTVWVLAEAISLTGSDGATLRFISSFLDISSRRAMEEGLKASRDQVAEQAWRLQQQNAQLESDARLREDMERMSRHDLKTPLNSLIGVVRLLRDEKQQPPATRELLDIAERAGYRMLEMVNLSLDLFRMEQGTYVFQPQAVDLGAIVARVMVDMRSLADGGHVEIVFANEGLAWHVRGEELLCYCIVANLVKNAVEATPPGGRVDISFVPGTPVRLRIHNPGSLTPAVARGFFEKYFSGGKPGGSGLGTYSARLMARVQLGELVLDTGPGRGVTVELSLQPPGADLRAAAGAAGRAGKTGEDAAPMPTPSLAGHVLVVDDDDYNQLLMRRFLPGAPLEVAVAVHGRACLEAVARRWPDVVLMDMEMPVMDGIEATRRVRLYQEEHALPACTIVMMSSNNDDDPVARGLEAGADIFLQKPVVRDVLLGMLSSLLPAAPPPRDALAEPVEPVVVRVDAALVDDAPAFLESRRDLLRAMDHALGAQDHAALRALAHRCRGGLSSWGFDWAAAQCESLELNAGHATPAALRKLLTGLERHLLQVRVEASRED